jgi:hypothetical protein
MAERPILFGGPMVRAILDGKKSQTRRVLTVRPRDIARGASERDVKLANRWKVLGGEARLLLDQFEVSIASVRCPYGAPGDELWVRETHAIEGQCVAYDADGWCGAVCSDGGGGRFRVPHGRIADARTKDRGAWPAGGAQAFGLAKYGGRWRPSIHMPRWASRLSLRVLAVRVERLQDITESDILGEGVTVPIAAARTGVPWSSIPTLHDAWRLCWDSINGKRAPWSSNPYVWVVEFERAPAPSAQEPRGG